MINTHDNGSVNRFLFIDPMACKMLCKTSEQLFDQFHGKPEVLSVARFHSDRLPISLDAFMRYFFLRLKPSLMARFKRLESSSAFTFCPTKNLTKNSPKRSFIGEYSYHWVIFTHLKDFLWLVLEIASYVESCNFQKIRNTFRNKM